MDRAGRAARLDETLSAIVRAGRVPGIAAAVVDRDTVLYQHAVGVVDQATGTPMRADAVFRIASLTKLVTAISALQLIELGALELTTPVGDLLPQFDDLPVLERFDGDEPVLRPQRHRATVEHLMNNTAGLGYDTFEPDLLRYQRDLGIPNISRGSLRAFDLPLVADPGTAFTYGTSYDWLGRVVERVSGLPLDSYFEQHVLRPLGMNDTSAYEGDEQRSRLASVHLRDDKTNWRVFEVTDPSSPEFVPGGHSLSSTIPDYATLLRALLAGGRLGDVALLTTEHVDEMFTNQIGALRVPSMTSCNPAYSSDLITEPETTWGFGMALSGRRGAGMRPQGSGGWAGAYNTFFWVDRANGLAGLFFTQTLPFYDPGVVAAFGAFERAVYASFPG